ncbi:MAG: isoprenylcysteine carboxylmethyltransferase family protein [Blautia sp.]|nr:isoprenylcysteine carboxylmethyltransferase family protein [Blautia sp.]
MKTVGIIILLFFYSVYIGKMLRQKRQGIQTDQMARGKTKNRLFYTELILKIATYTVVAVEVASIFTVRPRLPWGALLSGAVLGVIGDIIFAAAVFTMKDSWRAGVAEKDQTEMVTEGIYRFSRNPAFLGFDCVYAGVLLMYFNIPLLVFSVFAMIMLHLQILQEERYLQAVFGDDYIAYKNKVCRYLGRKG